MDWEIASGPLRFWPREEGLGRRCAGLLCELVACRPEASDRGLGARRGLLPPYLSCAGCGKGPWVVLGREEADGVGDGDRERERHLDTECTGPEAPAEKSNWWWQ